MPLLSLLPITGALKLCQASCGTKCLRMSGAMSINKTLPRTSPLRGRSAVLRIEPLRVSPLRAAVTDASGLRPPRSAWQPISRPCGAVSPVTGRAAPGNSQYGAATRRRAAVPARRRAAPTAHPRGGRAAAAWRRAGLWLSREGGWPGDPVMPAVSGDLPPVSGGVRRGRLPCPDGHKNR